MGWIKAYFLGDSFKEYCIKTVDELSLEKIFTISDGFDFADGSAREYNDYVKTVTADQHMTDIKSMLRALKEGPAAEEANFLLDCVNSIEIIASKAKILSEEQKDAKGLYDPECKFVMDALAEEISRIAGDSGKRMSMSEALDSLNRKTGYDLFDNRAMTGLSLLVRKADDIISDYEAACIDNLENERNIRESAAAAVNKTVDESNAEYEKLKTYTSDRFLPSQVPAQRQAAIERKENLTKEYKESLREMNSKEFELGRVKDDIRSLKIHVDLDSKAIAEGNESIKNISKSIEKLTNEAKDNLADDNYTKVRPDELSDVFIEDLYTLPLDQLQVVDEATIAQLAAFEGQLDHGQVNMLEGLERNYKELSEKPSLVSADQYKALLLFAEGKSIKGKNAGELKAFCEKLKSDYDKAFPVADNRGSIAKFFGSKTLSSFETAIKNISDKARSGKDISSNDVQKGIGELFGKMSDKFRENKRNINGYVQIEQLNARKVAVKNLIKERRANQAGADKHVADINYLRNLEKEKEAAVAKASESLKKERTELEAKESRLRVLESEYETAKKQNEDMYELVQKNDAVLKVCDAIDKKTAKCAKMASKAAEKVNAFRKNFTDVKDGRNASYKAAIDNFCEHIMDNKGSRSNSTQFEDMARTLTELQTLVSSGQCTTAEFREKLDAVNASSDAYLRAKAEQKMVLGTTRRKSRLAFARKLKNWTAKTAENMGKKLPENKYGPNETKLRNLQDIDIKVPGFLEVENPSLLKDQGRVERNVQQIMAK